MKIVQPAVQSARTKDADGTGHHTIKMCPLSMWMWLLWSLGVGTSVQYSNDIPSAGPGVSSVVEVERTSQEAEVAGSREI